MSKVHLITETGFPPSGFFLWPQHLSVGHQKERSTRQLGQESQLKLMNLEFGIQKYHEILLIFHGFVCFFPATNGKSDKFNPRKPSRPLWFACSMWWDAARVLRYLHLLIHANSPKLQRRGVLIRAARQPFNVRLTQSTCGRKPGGATKKNPTDHNFSRITKKKLKKKLPFFGVAIFFGRCNSHPKKRVGRFDFNPELLESFLSPDFWPPESCNPPGCLSQTGLPLWPQPFAPTEQQKTGTCEIQWKAVHISSQKEFTNFKMSKVFSQTSEGWVSFSWKRNDCLTVKFL